MDVRTYLLVGFADSGQLNPTIAVAQHLERAGHNVVIHSLQDDVSARCRAAGLRARCVHGGAAPVGAMKTEEQRSLRYAQRLTSDAWVKRWMHATLVGQVPSQIEMLRPFVARERPDVIVTNAMTYGAGVVAELEGIPWVSLTTGLHSLSPGPSSVFAAIAPEREKMVAAQGVRLEFRESDMVSPWLNAVLAYPELVPEDLRPASTLLVGPAVPLGARGDERSFPFERLPEDRPIVYIAFGSLVSHPPEVYQALIGAVSPEEAFFVVTVKDLIGEPFVRDFPPNVLAVDYAPQLEVLSRASVMVNHGGVNSVNECILRGRPMIAIPLTAEQKLVARLVEHAGFGVALDAGMATTARCRELLAPLLRRDAPERGRLSEVKPRNGAAEVARLAAAVARGKRHPTPDDDGPIATTEGGT